MINGLRKPLISDYQKMTIVESNGSMRWYISVECEQFNIVMNSHSN